MDYKTNKTQNNLRIKKNKRKQTLSMKAFLKNSSNYKIKMTT